MDVEKQNKRSSTCKRRSSFIRGRNTYSDSCYNFEWELIENAAYSTIEETVLELEKENKMQDNSCENVILHARTYIHQMIEAAANQKYVQQPLKNGNFFKSGIQRLTKEDTQWDEVLQEYKNASLIAKQNNVTLCCENLNFTSEQLQLFKEAPDCTSIIHQLYTSYNMMIAALDQLNLFASNVDESHNEADAFLKHQVELLGNVHNPNLDTKSICSYSTVH